MDFIPNQASSAAEVGAEATTCQKLVKSHAYSVTGVQEVKAGWGGEGSWW